MSQDFVIDHTDTHGPDHLVPPELQNDPSMTVWIYIMHERYVHDVERFVPGNLLAARSVQSTAWGPAVSMVDPVLHTPAQELLLLHATVACPSCMFPLQAEHRICSNCGFWVSPSLKDALVRQAYEAAYFGWRYRRKFEEDIEPQTDNKVPPRHYFLGMPDDFAIWLAGAVAGGIIGNASFDAVKASVKLSWQQAKGQLIRAFNRRSAEGSIRQFDMSLVNDEQVVDRFIEYAYEYFGGLKDPESPVSKTHLWALRMEALRIYRLENNLTPDAQIDPEEAQQIMDNPVGLVAAFTSDYFRRQQELENMVRIVAEIKATRENERRNTGR